MDDTADVAATFCATLVDEWARAGLTEAVLSPGSRSTPMALALAGDPRLRLHVFLDERSAAFFALGIGLRTGVPALVLTTSGTAAVELHPAIVEAHHAGVPLLALTADRPPEAHGVGAAQTIDQTDLYGRALRWRADPGVPDAATASSWRSLAARAVAEAAGFGGRPGPVQLNLAFREPLVGRPGPLPPGRRHGAPWHLLTAALRMAPSDMDEMAEQLSGRSGVIVSGADSGDPATVHRLAETLGWPVLADARSPARLPAPATVTAFDALLRHGPFAERGRPDIILRLGALPASKVLATWSAASGAEQWGVAANGAWLDPDRTVDRLLAAEPADVCAALADRKPAAASDHWTRLWADGERLAQEAIGRTLVGHPELTEPGLARDLVAGLPPGTGLVVANSMPIRDVEWYAAARTGIRVMANRGVNGIDGTVSTVLGVAAGTAAVRQGGATVGLVGDLAFLHDAGSLVGAKDRDLDAVIVVMDNKGGGIFSFLPQATAVPAPLAEQLFGTPHDIDLVPLTALHGLAAAEITAADQLRPAVTAALATGGITVIVARTDRSANVDVHNEIQAAVATALDVSLA